MVGKRREVCLAHYDVLMGTENSWWHRSRHCGDVGRFTRLLMNLVMRRGFLSMGSFVLMTAVSRSVRLVLKAHDGGLELVQLVLIVIVSLVGQGSFFGQYFFVLMINCIEVQKVMLELVLEQVHGVVLASGARWNVTDNA